MKSRLSRLSAAPRHKQKARSGTHKVGEVIAFRRKTKERFDEEKVARLRAALETGSIEMNVDLVADLIVG
jgi:anti-sigma28 factor (negative regulator of flagellin synthesis)